MPTPTPTPAPGSPPVAARSHPVYTVHELMPNAPSNAIALTIDDGPDPRWTPQVLALLDRHGLKATFFLVGYRVRTHPGLARRIVAAGHSVGNHTYNHRIPFTGLSAAQIDAEIGNGQTAILEETGYSPRLARTPGGAYDTTILAKIAEHGLIPVNWDVDPKDWSRPGTATIEARLLATRPGDILLCHDGGGDRSQTVAALADAIPALLTRGLRFVPLT